MLTEYDSCLKNVEHRGHYPVMLKEAVAILSPKDGMDYLDCTFGGGGHSRAILESANCRVTAVDRDPAAAERAAELKKIFPERFNFIRANFSEICKLQTDKGYAGILFDFGVSSFQLDEASRGFSFMREGPLDMRMDSSEGQTALDLINSLSEIELAKIFREYAEIPNFSKLARAVKAAADAGKISTTRDLAETVEKISPSIPRGKIHPATLVFQALRIAVNDELGEIERALPEAFELLCKGGVLVAISFHSLEDRIVKKFFKKMAGRPEDRHDHSSVQDRIKLATILTRKPVLPSESETAENPRSRSAKLRAIKKD